MKNEKEDNFVCAKLIFANESCEDELNCTFDIDSQGLEVILMSRKFTEEEAEEMTFNLTPSDARKLLRFLQASYS